MKNYSFKDMQRLAIQMSIHEKYNHQKVIDFVSSNIALGKREYEVFTYLCTLGKANMGVSFPSNHYMAEKFGVSQARINQLVKALEKKGVIILKKVRRSTSFHSFYIIPTIGMLQQLVEVIYDGLLTGKQIISEVYENIKSTVKKVAEKVQNAYKNESSTNAKQQPKKAYNGSNYGYKKPIRTEVIPEYFKQPEYPTGESNKEYSNSEIEAKREEFRKRIEAL